jgi:hypothetical protein
VRHKGRAPGETPPNQRFESKGLAMAANAPTLIGRAPDYSGAKFKPALWSHVTHLVSLQGFVRAR